MIRLGLAVLAMGVLVLTGLAYAKADPTDTIDQPDLNGLTCNQVVDLPPGVIADEPQTTCPPEVSSNR